jgi:hypothetical protein
VAIHLLISCHKNQRVVIFDDFRMKITPNSDEYSLTEMLSYLNVKNAANLAVKGSSCRRNYDLVIICAQTEPKYICEDAVGGSEYAEIGQFQRRLNQVWEIKPKPEYASLPAGQRGDDPSKMEFIYKPEQANPVRKADRRDMFTVLTANESLSEEAIAAIDAMFPLAEPF